MSATPPPAQPRRPLAVAIFGIGILIFFVWVILGAPGASS